MKFPGFVFLVMFTVIGCANADEYVFRNDDRPTFAKSVDIAEMASLDAVKGATIIDVRLLEDFESDPVLIPGASYKNPEEIDQWFSAIPKDSPVIVYCVKGKWVSHKAAHFLEQKGYDVFTLDGGIQEWQSKNAP